MNTSFTIHESTFATDGMEVRNLAVRCVKTSRDLFFPGLWRVKRWWKSKKFGTYRIDLEELNTER